MTGDLTRPSWQCDATIETGMPDGPEECLRTAHLDSRHEGVNLEWWDDDDQATSVAPEAPEDDWEPCTHDCDEGCYDEQDEWRCTHQHCFACGGCGCPGYCDDHQTYNLRPDETGGDDTSNGDSQ